MSNLDFFNQLAKTTNTYLNTARMVSFNFGIFKKTFDDVNRKLNFQMDDMVLDLGGGCGQITRYIAEACREVVLADGAPETLRVAQKTLKNHANISYQVLDIRKPPLPFSSNRFDKILCYSVVHYLESLEEFEILIAEFLRISKPQGKILIGDIPLKEKYESYLQERRKSPLKNFVLNQRYYLKKYFTQLFYKIKGINADLVKGLIYTKDAIAGILQKFSNIRFEFLKQDPKLPFANSREDLLIIKK